MQRFGLPVLLLLSVISLSESYTVIFKTGKTLQGTLVAETDDSIVFKDTKGIQFSLKKKSLDLDKMKEANAAPAVTTPVPEPTIPAAPPTQPKKASKVYTSKDIEALRDKYADIAPTSDDGDAPMVGTVTRENYHKYLQDAGAHMGAVITHLSSLMDGMATAWEVASSTGRDPSISVKEYMGGKAATEILSAVASEMSTLDSFGEALENPPKEFAPILETFTSGVGRLREANDLIRQYDGKQNMTVFRSRITGIFTEVRPRISTLQSVQPLVPEAPPEPDATQPPTDEEPQTQPEDENPTEQEPPNY
jgi:hypothetical protein